MYSNKYETPFLSIVINPKNISTGCKLLASFRIRENWLKEVKVTYLKIIQLITQKCYSIQINKKKTH